MRRAKILLVDDEATFTKYLSIFLSNRGYEVAAADNGTRALEMIDGADFDLVVLDLKMPGISGMETLKVLKKREPCMEVIILTGHATVDSAIEGIGLGAFDYATKPVTLNDLHERITQAVQRKYLREKQQI
jgi:DNA-binding NtrC family response regulator